MRDLEKQDQNDGSLWVQCGQICLITDIEDVKGEKDVVARKALMKKIFGWSRLIPDIVGEGFLVLLAVLKREGREEGV